MTTTVTVLGDDGEVDVCPAEHFLRRTSVQVIIEANGCLDIHAFDTFEDACEFDNWCARHGLSKSIQFVEIPEPLS